jgi:sulfite reductase (ferredoxin)
MISVTGCPNSCAQYQIADIGLQGVPVRVNGERIDGFHVFVGGRMGREPQFGRVVIDGEGRKIKVPAVQIHDVIETLLRTYRSEKEDGDRFSTWAERLDISRLAELIAIGTAPNGGSE